MQKSLSVSKKVGVGEWAGRYLFSVVAPRPLPDRVSPVSGSYINPPSGTHDLRLVAHGFRSAPAEFCFFPRFFIRAFCAFLWVLKNTVLFVSIRVTCVRFIQHGPRRSVRVLPPMCPYNGSHCISPTSSAIRTRLFLSLRLFNRCISVLVMCLIRLHASARDRVVRHSKPSLHCPWRSINDQSTRLEHVSRVPTFVRIFH